MKILKHFLKKKKQPRHPPLEKCLFFIPPTRTNLNRLLQLYSCEQVVYFTKVIFNFNFTKVIFNFNFTKVIFNSSF
jgi:hypothetical protein